MSLQGKIDGETGKNGKLENGQNCKNGKYMKKSKW